ncbi:hypothetical protein [Thermosphaera sp.]
MSYGEAYSASTPISVVNLAEEEVRKLAEELSEYLSVYSVLEDEKVYGRILGLVNRFLELASPITYYPELASAIFSKVELRLWEVEIPGELLEELFLNTYRLKQATLAGRSEELETVGKALAVVLTDLYTRLEADELIDMVNQLENSTETSEGLEKILSLSVLTLIAATNQ